MNAANKSNQKHEDTDHVGKCNEIKSDLVQMARLALGEQVEDVRLFAARLVRKYRKGDHELGEMLNAALRTRPSREVGAFRGKDSQVVNPPVLPHDNESRLPLLKVYRDEPERVSPILPADLDSQIAQLVLERRSLGKLLGMGLRPTRSAIFLGSPGVGKTLTARWIASQLGLPLYVLDLTAVMSSLLGKTGANIRIALDFAKTTECVILLDEVDAIAKSRGDDSDIGELKRLVAVILQEVENWPDTSLLLAATNFAELIDPALWRRFDMVVRFPLPTHDGVKEAIMRFLGNDIDKFLHLLPALEICFSGCTYSEIELAVGRFRRAVALDVLDPETAVKEYIASSVALTSRQDKINLASQLASKTKLSQHTISEITGVSRDTIRKRHGGK